jgi:hypothetical protein
MTIASYNLICSDCSYRTSYSAKARYKNPFEDELACPVIRLAWCHSCDSLVQAIRNLDSKELEFELSNINAYIDRLRSKGLFGKLFGLSAEKSALLAKLLHTRDHILSKLKFYNARKAICLECGSDDVQSATMPDKDFPTYNTIDINHKCGGLILAENGFCYHRDLPLIESPYANLLRF